MKTELLTDNEIKLQFQIYELTLVCCALVHKYAKKRKIKISLENMNAIPIGCLRVDKIFFEDKSTLSHLEIYLEELEKMTIN